MKKYLFSLFQKHFAPEIKVLENTAFSQGYHKHMDDSRAERKHIECMEMQSLIDKPVICVSNEWDTPVIGFVSRVDLITRNQDPVLIVWDEITNEEVLVMGKTYIFTLQRFEAIMKLDPFEACSLIYNSFYEDGEWVKNKLSVRLSRDEIIQKLQKNDFFAKCKIVQPALTN